jgi:hypothetical protein
MRGCIGRVALTLAIVVAISGLIMAIFSVRAPSSVLAAAVLSVSPSSGPPGIPVTVSGGAGSLPQNVTAQIIFRDANGSTRSMLGVIPPTLDGSFSKTVIIPTPATGGDAELAVVSTVTLAASFHVLPVLTVDPATAVPGGTVRVTGNGYAANAPISLGLDNVQLNATGTPMTNVLGGFIASVTLPLTLTGGQHTFIAYDGTNASLQATAQIAIIAPTATPTVTVTPLPPTATPSATPTTTASPIVAGPATTAYFAEGYTGLATSNGKASFSEVLSILNPNPIAVPVTITYYIAGAAQPRAIMRAIPPATCIREVVNADVGPDKLVAAAIAAPRPIYASRTIMRVSATGRRLDGSTTGPALVLSTRWDFPEGYTGISFQEYLTLLNPSTVPATVRVTLAPQSESAVGASTLTLSVPPRGRATANIRALNAGSARSVGMLVTSTLPIVAERVEYFGDGAGSGKFGSTVSLGIPVPADTLHVAYGTSGGVVPISPGVPQPVGDQEYITLLNPGAGGAQVTARVADALGRPVAAPVEVSVAPGTRRTVVLNAVLGRAAGPVSVTLTSSQPIEAEAAQYYGGSPNIGAHPGVALPALDAPARDLFLTDLGSRLLDGTAVSHVIYLYNPGADAMQVTAIYFGGSGATVQRTYGVPAGGITAVLADQDVQATFPAGPLGAELQITGATGGVFAVSIGRTAGGLSATAETGMPAI